MPLHQTDINGFKSDLFLLPYGPLKPMVISFTHAIFHWYAFRCTDPPLIYISKLTDNVRIVF